MRWISPAAFIAGFLLFASSAPAQATRPEEPDARAAAQADLEKDMRDVPNLGERQITDVVAFHLRDGKIILETQLPEAGPVYLKLKGLGGWARATVLGRRTLHSAGDQRFLQLIYRDLSVPGAIQAYTEIYATPGVVNVSRETQLPDDGMTSVQFIQSAAADANAAALYIQSVIGDSTASHPSRRVSAASLAELAQKDPADVDQYLRPIFRMLGQEQIVFEVDAKAAYQVLSSLCPVDAQTAAAVNAAVAGMGADSYADREAAMGKLMAVGEPAAIELMRSRAAHLSAEQSMRVDLFLAPYRPLPDETAKKLAKDVDFLLDCLFSADPLLRDLARRQFQIVTGKEIAFDDRVTGPALGNAAAALRP